MKSEVLEFKPGVPERVALKFPTSKEINTARGMRFLFSLTDGRVMFTGAQVAGQVQALGLKIGEPFRIGYREAEVDGRKVYEWRVGRIEATTPSPARKEAATKPTQPTHVTHNGIPYRDPKSEWLRCADEAVQVLVTVREHATAAGLPVQFSGEDVRQVAATLYIQRSQERRFAPSSYR
jgi:hypothetical protein